LTPEFYDDAVFKYLLQTFTEETERRAVLHVFMRLMVKVAILEHGTVLEVSNWGAVGVLCPPGTKLENPITLIRGGAVSFIRKLGVKNLPVGAMVHSCIGSHFLLAYTIGQTGTHNVPHCREFSIIPRQQRR